MEEEAVNQIVIAGQKSVQRDPIVGPDGNTYIPVPAGFGLQRVEPTDPKLPSRIIASPNFIEQASFINYVNRFKRGSTVIFAKPNSWQPHMAAAIDYHEPKTPLHNNHFATFKAQYDEWWKRWQAIDGQLIDQEKFAYFIEEMLPVIAEPDGADLLTMAQTLKVNRGVVFKTNRTLKDGTVDIEFSEKDQTSSAGHVGVPDHIAIYCPIFLMRPAERVEAKLRYRVDKGEPLRFRIDILNRKMIELDAFEQMRREVEAATEVATFLSE